MAPMITYYQGGGSATAARRLPHLRAPLRSRFGAPPAGLEASLRLV